MELSQRERLETDDYDYEGWQHRFQLNCPVSETEVADFEATHKVSLPTDYRHFITKIGNGGAGPSGGFDRFGMYSGTTPFDDGILDALSLPFDDELAEDWEDDDPEFPDVMQGAMIIGGEGCGTWYWLIVTGPSAGQVWLDPRADGGIPDPMVSDTRTMSFREWYEDWLVESLKKYERFLL